MCARLNLMDGPTCSSLFEGIHCACLLGLPVTSLGLQWVTQMTASIEVNEHRGVGARNREENAPDPAQFLGRLEIAGGTLAKCFVRDDLAMSAWPVEHEIAPKEMPRTPRSLRVFEKLPAGFDQGTPPMNDADGTVE